MVSTRPRIDLNADLGESFGSWWMGDDAAMLSQVTSANIACGFHAGDPLTLRTTARLAAESGVAVGAHVGYHDLAGFGRRFLDASEPELSADVLYQLSALEGVAQVAGTRVAYVKPHGALYHRVLDDQVQARALLDGSGDLAVLGMVPGAVVDEALARGRRVHAEAFPDRGYTPQGRLVPRGEPGALVAPGSAVARRAVELAASGRVDSLCLHGDSPGAVETARRVRRALEAGGWSLRGLDAPPAAP